MCQSPIKAVETSCQRNSVSLFIAALLYNRQANDERNEQRRAGKSTAHKGLIGCRRIDFIPAETNILPKNAITKGEQRCSVF